MMESSSSSGTKESKTPAPLSLPATKKLEAPRTADQSNNNNRSEFQQVFPEDISEAAIAKAIGDAIARTGDFKRSPGLAISDLEHSYSGLTHDQCAEAGVSALISQVMSAIPPLHSKEKVACYASEDEYREAYQDDLLRWRKRVAEAKKDLQFANEPRIVRVALLAVDGLRKAGWSAPEGWQRELVPPAPNSKPQKMNTSSAGNKLRKMDTSSSSSSGNSNSNNAAPKKETDEMDTTSSSSSSDDDGTAVAPPWVEPAPGLRVQFTGKSGHVIKGLVERRLKHGM
jgi:hypothetical protein